MISEEGRYWNYLCSLRNAYDRVLNGHRVSEEARTEFEVRVKEINEEIDKLSELNAVMLP